MASDSGPAGGPGRPAKVQRLVDEYGLKGVGAELQRRWRGEGTDRSSLRDLATRFNERLLDVALSDTGLARFDGDAANLYRLLTDDDVSSGERIRVERRIERAGVDVETLRGDFVSYQAIRTYLKDRPGVEYESEPSRVDVDDVAEQLNQLQSRTAAVTEDKIRRLAAGGELSVDSPRAIVSVDVACDGCGRQFELDELLAVGGCGCGE